MNVTSPIAEAMSQINYTYDSVNQLMSATKTVQSNSNESFTYDNLGNRLKKNNQSTNNVYDNNNRIVSDEVYNYTHDDNGNMIKKVKRATGYTTKYVWDFENKLQFIKEYTTETDTTPVKTHTFLYDVYGRRIVKDSDGVVHKYVFDNEDILFEFDNNDNLVSQFTHGPGIDEPVEIIQNNQNYYYHVDGIGSITGISNTNGEIVQSYAYSSFGETKVYDQAGTLIDPIQMQVKSPYGYTSREFDFETEKYQYRARDYIPSIGRFVSEDPIGFAGRDLNIYRYVENNPSNFTDPSGLIVYQCKRPLSGLDTIYGPLNHTFVCVNGYCNGQTGSGILPGAGRPSNDGNMSQNGNIKGSGAGATCSEVTPNKDINQQCFDKCVKEKLSSPQRPTYGIPFGTDCQEFASNSIGSCMVSCKVK